MSIRTLIEINHDSLHRLIAEPEFLQHFLRELTGTTYNREFNAANEAGRALDIGHGVRVVLQRHHTTDVTVKTEYTEVKL